MVDGQINLLISFICHSWCVAPSLDPLATTMSRQSSGLSRQYAQPCSEPLTNAIACPQYAGSPRRSWSAQMASCSMPTPSCSYETTLRSDGWYNAPVAEFLASSTCAYSLYVIASAASISPESNPFMSKFCPSSVTSLAGSSPSFDRAAKISYSLPNPQLPIFLSLNSFAEVMFLSLKLTCSVPLRWNTWAMSVTFAPASRSASAFGTHEIAKSTAPLAKVFCGGMSTPPSTICTSSPASL